MKNLLLFHKYTITTILVGFFGILLFFSLLFSSGPFNPVQYKLRFIKKIFNVTPQGWAFFTKEARDEQIYIYKLENNKLYKINQKHSNFENFFGLSRKISKEALELENVTAKINKEQDAYNTVWNYDANIIGKIPADYITVQNPIKNPILCGDYLVVYHEIVPWAWSKSRNKIKMPAKIIKLRVKCQQ